MQAAFPIPSERVDFVGIYFVTEGLYRVEIRERGESDIHTGYISYPDATIFEALDPPLLPPSGASRAEVPPSEGGRK